MSQAAEIKDDMVVSRDFLTLRFRVARLFKGSQKSFQSLLKQEPP